jgi:hypothetical protein
LLAKFSQFKPLIVCFVGIGIWDSIEYVIKKTLPPPATGSSKLASSSKRTPKQEPVGLRAYKLVHSPLSLGSSLLEPTSSISSDDAELKAAQESTTSRKMEEEGEGELPVKREDESEGLRLLNSQDLADFGLTDGNVKETLFFVVPSTSGRVTGYQVCSFSFS